MKATTITIKLSELLQEFIEAQRSSRGLASAEDYIVTLLSDEERRGARKGIEALVREGLNSGPSKEMTKADWQRLRQCVKDEVANRDAS